MKIISIDTSGEFCSVSISLPNKIEELINSSSPLSHSSELAINIKKIINKYNVLKKDLDCIVINIGPGSFTGLRIGVSFAKGLSFSNDIPLIPINSFDIIRNKINPTDESFYLCIHSHKDYAYGQKYNNGEKSTPELINLNDYIDIPVYISGLPKNNIYNNDLINIDFTSLDLLEIWQKYFDSKATNDLNSINPIYIDYINADCLYNLEIE